MTPILLLGCDGQVGQAWQKLAQEAGVALTALGRPDCDLADPVALETVLKKYRPQIIINAAAYTAVDQAQEHAELAYAINAQAPAIMARYLQGVPYSVLVHYSTDYVFDGQASQPYTPADLCEPLSVYGQSKRAGELAIIECYAAAGARSYSQSQGQIDSPSPPDSKASECATEPSYPQSYPQAQPQYYILRTSWVYGAGRNFIQTMLSLAQSKEVLRVVADQIGAPTSATFLAQAGQVLLRALAPSGIYHAVPHGSVSWHGLAEFVIGQAQGFNESCAWPIQDIVPIGSEDYPLPAPRPKNSRLAYAALAHYWAQEANRPYPTWQADVSAYVSNYVSDYLSANGRDRR